MYTYIYIFLLKCRFNWEASRKYKWNHFSRINKSINQHRPFPKKRAKKQTLYLLWLQLFGLKKRKKEKRILNMYIKYKVLLVVERLLWACLSVGLFWCVSHNFLKGRDVSLPCSYQWSACKHYNIYNIHGVLTQVVSTVGSPVPHRAIPLCQESTENKKPLRSQYNFGGKLPPKISFSVH